MFGRRAAALAEARAALGWLADHARTVEASSSYERVLLTLDAYTADASPDASGDLVLGGTRMAIDAARRSLVSIENLGLPELDVEVVLAMLDDAVAADRV